MATYIAGGKKRGGRRVYWGHLERGSTVRIVSRQGAGPVAPL